MSARIVLNLCMAAAVACALMTALYRVVRSIARDLNVTPLSALYALFEPNWGRLSAPDSKIGHLRGA